MTREELKALGLTDEQVDSVMAAHGNVVNSTKRELENMTSERDGLRETLEERDEQLNTLKDVDPEKLQKEIDELQAANKAKDDEHAKTVKDLQLTNAIKLAINGKVHDEDLAAGLIDKEKLVIGDDGKVVGLDEQLTSLQESKAFLFKQEESPAEPKGQPAGFRVGGDGQGTGQGSKDEFTSALFGD